MEFRRVLFRSIFGLNQLSQECMDNLGILAQNQELSTLQVAQGSISGHAPVTLPWANEAVGFALGAEYRTMEAEFIPDTALTSGDVAGFHEGEHGRACGGESLGASGEVTL